MSVITEVPWDLRRRALKDSIRHDKRVKDAIRRNLKELIAEENIIASDGKKLVKHVEERYHVTIAGGQGEMAGKIFRLAHMGFIEPFDILVGLGAVELSLLELGASVTPGESLKAAQAVIGQLQPVGGR